MNFDFWIYFLAVIVTSCTLAVVYGFFKKLNLIIFGPVVAVISLLIAPVTFAVGTNMAKADLTNYNEWWNGLEKKAWVDVTNCTRDGSCKHTYNCDSYQVPVTKTRTVTDSKGKTTTETYVEFETRWHSCPYVTKEFSYFVSDTMGKTYSFGSNLFPDNPREHRWENRGRALPRVASGVPANWTAAKARIDSGNPGGTTARHTYTNYVLAAQETVYRKYSSHIDDYLKDGYLPKPSSKLSSSPYFANKVYFVGGPNVPEAGWQEALQRFNGKLGGERQGDLHVVIVNADKVLDGNAYNNALEAYWQDKALGKDTLSKNGVVLILGVSGSTLKWSNGFTGMPEGNEAILQAFRGFTFPSVTPEAVFASDSSLSTTLMTSPGFKRVEMKNYKYLEDSIKPSGWAHFWMSFVTFALGTIVGGIFLAYLLSEYGSRSSRFNTTFYGKGDDSSSEKTNKRPNLRTVSRSPYSSVRRSLKTRGKTISLHNSVRTVNRRKTIKKNNGGFD